MRCGRRLPLIIIAVAALLLASCDGGAESNQDGAQAQQTPVEEPGRFTVEADEHEFSGVPEAIGVGTSTFILQNIGSETHEMIVYKLNTDDELADVLDLPREELAKVVQVVGSTFASTGEQGLEPVTADLDPGRYAIVCLLPIKGSTTHFDEGMFAEFVVR